MLSWRNVLIGSFIFVLIAPQTTYAATSITPTLFCLGSCPHDTTSTASSPSGGVGPSGAQTSPSGAVPSPSASAAPSTVVSPTPCSTSVNSTSIESKKKGKSNKGKNHQKKQNGFLAQFIQFLLQLLQLIAQKLGIQLPSIPGLNGNPCGTSPSPSASPSSTPSSGPAPSSGVPSGSTQPTATPKPGAGQPTTNPTTPVTSSSCTNPKYTIQMDPNNAQNGVTIGNFYLTADTWNASNYQLSQTVYACDYNNWYAVATMNNNNGDGAVKTSPNVHEDVNKPLNSLKTITSTFAESGPHVGIYEFEYDLWLNGFDNGHTEIMIWNDNFGQTPSGSKQGTFTDNGHTYDVYKSGSDYIAFVAQTNFTSGTVNILNFFNYVVSKGWASASSTVSQLDYGIELVSTNNAPATFKVTNFSLTVN
ncbi:MAG TPA: hypothetical protein VLF93_03140 [Candidatus Saccharimonadales bacterium]|nr:hypothetical protein [Candidatus Saccharimonadales bacterium]